MDCHDNKSDYDLLVEEMYTSDTVMQFWECQKCGARISRTKFIEVKPGYSPYPPSKALIKRERTVDEIANIKRSQNTSAWYEAE